MPAPSEVEEYTYSAFTRPKVLPALRHVVIRQGFSHQRLLIIFRHFSTSLVKQLWFDMP